MSFCVLVASSDDRKDIFDVCFAHSERIWAECNWPRYVGLSSPHPKQYGFEIVTANPTGNWCKDVAQYVDNLPQRHTHILLMVEDALFLEPVDGEALDEAAYKAIAYDFSYLRLVPQRKTWFGKMFSSLAFDSLSGFDLISLAAPYYSSTEMVLWKRDYLRALLDRPADAWSFENLTSPVGHWAVRYPVFKQHQIIQKGCWNRDAPRYLAKAGLPPPPPDRRYQSLFARLRGHWQNINFALFGFTSVRIKQWLKSS